MKIAFCDLEGTLISLGNWSKVANAFGGEKITKEFFELYKDGKVGYEEWRQELIKIWKENKVTKKEFAEKLKDYKLMPGAKELITGLKKKGYHIIIITGAISVLAEMAQKEMRIDELYCGYTFEFDKKERFQTIINAPAYREGKGKVLIINEILRKKKAKKEDCIAIGGDDINDEWMMKELKSFAVKPHLRQIKEVVNYEVEKLIDILKYLE